MTIISNKPGFKLFTLNQVIDEVKLSDEVNYWEQPGGTLPVIFYNINSLKRNCWIFCRKSAMLGDYFCYTKIGGLCTSNQSKKFSNLNCIWINCNDDFIGLHTLFQVCFFLIIFNGGQKA